MSHYSRAEELGRHMRPDDRIWMHQLGYLKNHRGTAITRFALSRRNELLAELHLCTKGRDVNAADATW
jgi:hypothetical protein